MGLGNEVFLSFLPLSHSYEHMAGQFFPISIGAEIYYAEGIESLGANMIEARPTIMTAVSIIQVFHLQTRLLSAATISGVTWSGKMIFSQTSSHCKQNSFIIAIVTIMIFCFSPRAL